MTVHYTTPNGGSGSSTLAGLTDVSLSSLTGGEVLTYNAISGKWENIAPSGGGSAGAQYNIQVADNAGGFDASSSFTTDAYHNIFQILTTDVGVSYGWRNGPFTIGGNSGNPAFCIQNGASAGCFFDMSGGTAEFINGTTGGDFTMGTDNAVYLTIHTGGTISCTSTFESAGGFICSAQAGQTAASIPVFNDGTTSGQLTSLTFTGGILTGYTTL